MKLIKKEEIKMIDESPTPGFSFGMRMGMVREDHGLSVSAMAKSVGVAPSTWNSYENDKTFPGPQTIVNFCSIYHVNEEWLNTNYGWIYEDGYKPGDPLGEPVDYEKTIMDQFKELQAQYWIASIGRKNYERLVNKMEEMEKTNMISEKLKKYRETHNLTKKEIAEKLGITPQVYGRYEGGNLAIPEKIQEKIKELTDTAVATEIEVKKTTRAKARKVKEAVEAANDEAVANTIEVKKNVRKVGRKAKEAVVDAVSAAATSDEAVATEIEVKKKVRSSARKAKEAVEDAAALVKDAVSPKPSIIIQSILGGTITPEEILSRIPSDADAVYIKPEENKAYWVKGSESGSIVLW